MYGYLIEVKGGRS